MVRVNLLPREVLDRRKYEQWYRYVFIGVVGLALIVLFAYAALYLMVQQKNEDLQVLREETTQYQAQADAFGVFEIKEQELVAREQIATTALSNRLNMGRLAEEVSLVLPDEVWLNNIVIGEETGLALTGNTPRSASESVDVAYKSIAKLLVRLNELGSLYDVWLVTAKNSEWSGWAAAAAGTSAALPAPVVGFQATGKVMRPDQSSTSATVVPVPTTPAN